MSSTLLESDATADCSFRRSVVPAVRSKHVSVLEPDGGGDRRQLDGIVTESAHARLEIGLSVVVRRMSCQLLVCALCTEVVCMSKRSVVALVHPRRHRREELPLGPGET